MPQAKVLHKIKWLIYHQLWHLVYHFFTINIRGPISLIEFHFFNVSCSLEDEGKIADQKGLSAPSPPNWIA